MLLLAPRFGLDWGALMDLVLHLSVAAAFLLELYARRQACARTAARGGVDDRIDPERV